MNLFLLLIAFILTSNFELHAQSGGDLNKLNEIVDSLNAKHIEELTNFVAELELNNLPEAQIINAIDLKFESFYKRLSDSPAFMQRAINYASTIISNEALQTFDNVASKTFYEKIHGQFLDSYHLRVTLAAIEQWKYENLLLYFAPVLKANMEKKIAIGEMIIRALSKQEFITKNTMVAFSFMSNNTRHLRDFYLEVILKNDKAYGFYNQIGYRETAEKFMDDALKVGRRFIINFFD